MIDNKSLDQSIGLAEKVASANVTLTTVEQSALEHILGAMELSDINPQSADEIRNVIKEGSTNDEHDGAIGIIADNAAKSILGTHHFVSKVVNPHIRDVLGSINAELETVLAKGNVTVKKVEIETLPSYMNLDTLESAVEQIASQDLYDSVPCDLGSYTKEEILSLIKFSSAGGFDDVLATNIIQRESTIEGINQLLAGDATPSIARCTPLVLVATLLLSKALFHGDNIKEGVTVSLSEYKARLNWLAVSCARELNEVYKNWRYLVSGKFVYLPNNKYTDLTIRVVGNTFKLLAEKGVTIEHLIGNDLLGRKFGFVDLRDNENARNELIHAYERKVASLENEKTARETETLIKVALTKIKADAIDKGDDAEVLARLNDDKVSLLNRATRACENVYASGKTISRDKLPELVAGLLISIYYAHTDALLYLDSIADFSEKYPDMGSADLARMARANLLVHWVYRQLCIQADCQSSSLI